MQRKPLHPEPPPRLPRSPQEIATQINAEESAPAGVIKLHNDIRLGWLVTGIPFADARNQALTLGFNEADLDINYEARLISPAHQWLADHLDCTPTPVDPQAARIADLEAENDKLRAELAELRQETHDRIEAAHLALWQDRAPLADRWSDKFTLSALREAWPRLPQERKEEIALRLVNDLCVDPHARGFAWQMVMGVRIG